MNPLSASTGETAVSTAVETYPPYTQSKLDIREIDSNWSCGENPFNLGHQMRTDTPQMPCDK